MRVLLLLSCAVLAASCKGLFIDHGNNYPCDFSEPPGTRDEVCQPGDICGLDNLCQKFIYEGPRFEGVATLPEYGPGTSEGQLLHPLVLNQRVSSVSADLPVMPNSKIFVRQDGGFYPERSGHITSQMGLLPTMLPLQFGMVAAAQTFHDTTVGPPKVLLRSSTGRLGVGTVGLPNTDPVRSGGLQVTVEGARVIELPDPTLSVPVAWGGGEMGAVMHRGPNWEYEKWVTGGPEVFDVAALAVGGRFWVFALEAAGVEIVDASDAGVSLGATMDTLSVTSGALKTDPATRIISAIRTASTPVAVDVLSTFQVNVTSTGPQLSAPWPDCRPCDPGERVELMAPSVRSGSATVDVICAGEARLPTAVRVFGSVALTQRDACLTEEISLPVPVSRFALEASRIVHWNSQWGLLLGGKHGEVWWGNTLTELEPEFLDRVPRDVAPALAGGSPALTVIADDYLAVQQNADNTQEQGELLNGFRRVPLSELGVAENSRLAGFVHGVEGWAVDSTGLLVRAHLGKNLPAGGARVQVGPRLVTSSEELIRDSIGGEAFTEADGGPIGFFLAADDSLYFVPDPEVYFKPENEGSVFVPDLTPEPSVPIRSLALERTPLGTDGIERGRGYLVTSRNVFKWELSGATWSSTPLELNVGEPVEVWFDQTRSALGRVGYRDGQIYSLPGGYPLAQALPEGPEGQPSQVIDYENLGGWPVAYTSTGLFIAGWDLKGEKLDNRFEDGVNKPMRWRKVTMPDGTEPWTNPPSAAAVRRQRTKPGKLFVARDEVVGTSQQYRLLLFTDDEVRQVARHVRVITPK